MRDLLDARGCLTAEGLAALARAPVGKAPPEAAAHLSSCGRCQDRLLGAAREEGEARSGGARKPYRNLAVFGLALLMMLVLLGITLAMLMPR